MMTKRSMEALLIFGLVLVAILWTELPGWLPREYREKVVAAACASGVLTTLREHRGGGGLTDVAVRMDSGLAARVLNWELEVGDMHSPDYWERWDAEFVKRVEEGARLRKEGRIVRVPAKTLVRVLTPDVGRLDKSGRYPRVIEVEVFRVNGAPLRGLVYWKNLDCLKARL